MYFQLPLIPITTNYQSADNYQPELSASQTLASFHQQAIMEDGTTTSIPYGPGKIYIKFSKKCVGGGCVV